MADDRCVCTVCYEMTTDVVERCAHSLCHICMEKLKAFRYDKCPMCRGPLACSVEPNESCDEEEVSVTEFLLLALAGAPGYRLRRRNRSGVSRRRNDVRILSV